MTTSFPLVISPMHLKFTLYMLSPSTALMLVSVWIFILYKKLNCFSFALLWGTRFSSPFFSSVLNGTIRKLLLVLHEVRILRKRLRHYHLSSTNHIVFCIQLPIILWFARCVDKQNMDTEAMHFSALCCHNFYVRDCWSAEAFLVLKWPCRIYVKSSYFRQILQCRLHLIWFWLLYRLEEDLTMGHPKLIVMLILKCLKCSHKRMMQEVRIGVR